MNKALNLARSPFLNPRPVLRLTLLLWTLGVVFAGLNVRLYWSHFSGSSEIRQQQQALAASIEAEEAEVEKLRAELASYDIDWQNEQADFLNSKIGERSFSWSQLFDRLGEVLPAEARVSSLSPEFSGGGRRGRSGPAENEIELGIRGMAKNSEVLLQFIDALFEHPSFRDPDLSSESLKDTGLLDFNLSVIYEARPRSEQQLTAESADEGEVRVAAEGASGAAAEAGAEAEPAREAEEPAGADDGGSSESATGETPS